MPARPRLLLFARAPRAGEVKTRLAPRLGAEGAAALYRAFLEDAGRVYLRPELWESVLCAEPDPSSPLFDGAFPAPWGRTAQAPGGLGDRLADAFRAAFAADAPAAVAVGSDHPALPVGVLGESFALLACGVDAVLVPAEDGGYCAIGLRAGVPVAEIFRDMPWSTGALFERTLGRLRSAGLRHRVLAAGYDVDRPEDLERLRRELAGRDPSAADYPAATAAALKALEGVLS